MSSVYIKCKKIKINYNYCIIKFYYNKLKIKVKNIN